MIPVWDQTLPTLITCLDATLHRLGGVPTYVLTDNPRTVSIDHVAGVPVRHPQIVEVGRHYGMQVHTCVPFDPESKGGTEATMKIAKADLVPTDANLRSDYASFAELEHITQLYEACPPAPRARPGARNIRGGEGRTLGEACGALIDDGIPMETLSRDVGRGPTWIHWLLGCHDLRPPPHATRSTARRTRT